MTTNLNARKQARMYTKPEFEIVEMDEEDIISTSNLTDDGELDLGGFGDFEWF